MTTTIIMKIVEVSRPFNADQDIELKLKNPSCELYWRVPYDDNLGPEYHAGDEYVLRLSKLV